VFYKLLKIRAYFVTYRKCFCPNLIQENQIMTLKTQELIDSIKNLLFQFEREIEYDNSGENFDVNLFAEDFYAELLNLIYPEWKLINLNRIIKNHPAIDLGGEASKVGIQVTSDNSKDKVQDTLDKFYRHKLEKKYDTIYILMIKGKGGIVNARGIRNQGGQLKIDFKKNKHIIDNTDILNWIRNNNCTIDGLREIEKLIKNQIRKKAYLYEKIMLPILRDIQKLKKFSDTPLNILHINNIYSCLKDSNTLPKFLNELEQYKDKIDIVVFNGNFTNPKNKYDSIEELAVKICSKLNVKKDAIIFSLGENEINHQKIFRWIEGGLLSNLNSISKVNEFTIQVKREKEFKPLEKVADFKAFEREYFKIPTNVKHNISHFESSYIQKCRTNEIGINTFNSFLVYSERNNKNCQIIGKEQILNGLAYIDDTDLKVAVFYFSPDALNSFDEDAITPLLEKYDIVLIGGICGHYTKYQTSFFKNTFFLIPELKDNINSSLQYIQFSPFSKDVKVINHFFNSEIEEYHTSKKLLDFPTNESLEYDKEGQKYLDNINSYFIEDIDKHLINYGTDSSSPSDLNGIFVEPEITDKPFKKDEKDVLINYNIDDLIQADNNFLILGRKESGKTVLLFKILLEYFSNYHFLKKLPVYLDFNEIKIDVERSIHKILSSKKTKLIERFSNGDIVLLIDNVEFNEENIEKLRLINTFIAKYPKIKVLITADRPYQMYLDADYIECLNDCNLITTYLKDFSSKQIKALATNWFSNKIDQQKPTKANINKIVESFNALGFPSTPMSISLYLWIVEKQEQRPINNSVLLECFIDNILDKSKKAQQIYREKFDAENKITLLSDIAHHMLEKENDNYSLEYGALVTYISYNLLEKGFNGENHIVFNPKTILKYFVDRGIFIEKDNIVKFRFECFFNYFLAQKMIRDRTFKESVLEEENYLNFINEIDYFTGLVRNQEDVLEKIYLRLKASFSGINEQHEQGKIAKDIDKIFYEDESIASKADINKIIASKPTEDDIEEIQDKALENVPVRTEIKRKKPKTKTDKNSFKLVKLAGNVLRNSEEVRNNNLKKEVFNEIIRDSALSLCIEKLRIIDYYTKYDELPHYIPWDININGLLKILPVIFQLNTYDFVGSHKIANVVYEKIINDKENIDISDIERFFSVFIYSDMKAPQVKKVLKDFIYKGANTNTVRDLSFFKLLSYFYLRTEHKNEEDFYTDLILEVKSKHNKRIKHEIKPKLLRDLRNKKRKNLNEE
jgi:hypothetical protein